MSDDPGKVGSAKYKFDLEWNKRGKEGGKIEWKLPTEHSNSNEISRGLLRCLQVKVIHHTSPTYPRNGPALIH